MEFEDFVRARYGALVRAAYLLTGSREAPKISSRTSCCAPAPAGPGSPIAVIRRLMSGGCS